MEYHCPSFAASQLMMEEPLFTVQHGERSSQIMRFAKIDAIVVLCSWFRSVAFLVVGSDELSVVSEARVIVDQSPRGSASEIFLLRITAVSRI